jgi:hypothetical protein
MGMAPRRNLDELPSEQVPGHEHGAEELDQLLGGPPSSPTLSVDILSAPCRKPRTSRALIEDGEELMPVKRWIR